MLANAQLLCSQFTVVLFGPQSQPDFQHFRYFHADILCRHCSAVFEASEVVRSKKIYIPGQHATRTDHNGHGGFRYHWSR
jgi:hypothetical protein